MKIKKHLGWHERSAGQLHNQNPGSRWRGMPQLRRLAGEWGGIMTPFWRHSARLLPINLKMATVMA